MHPRRLARLNVLIQQTISEKVLSLKDPDLGFVTITGSDTAADVSLVRVYYSVLGDQAQKERTAKVLKRAKSYFKRGLADLENLKRIPDLVFVFDETVERADRVNRLFHALEREGESDDAADVR